MKKPTAAATISEYIAGIAEPRKSEIEALHAMITRAIPKLKPSMQAGMIGYGTYHYKYASGREGDWPVVALASQKNYISVYVCAWDGGQSVAQRHKSELPKADIGQSCIRFKRLSDIDMKVLEKVVKEGARVMAKTVAARAGR